MSISRVAWPVLGLALVYALADSPLRGAGKEVLQSQRSSRGILSFFQPASAL